MKSFITSQFNYCLIVWICHSKSLNNKENHIYERPLLYSLSRRPIQFYNFASKGLFGYHPSKNLQLLALGIFEIKMNISLEIMSKIFDFPKNYAYELRCGNCLSRSKIHSTHFLIQSIANIAAKIQNKIPNKIKEACCFTVFKSKIKKYVLDGFPYRLCKIYEGHVSFT